MTLTSEQQELVKRSVGQLAARLAYRQLEKAEGKPQRWITVRGRHIPLFQGEKLEDALRRHFGRGGESSKGGKVQARDAADADHRRLDRHLQPIYAEPGTPLHQAHVMTEQLAEALHGPEATVGLAHNPAKKTYVAHSADAEGVGHGYQEGKTPEEALARHRSWLTRQISGRLQAGGYAPPSLTGTANNAGQPYYGSSAPRVDVPTSPYGDAQPATGEELGR